MCECVSIDGWFDSEQDEEVDDEEVDEEDRNRVLTFLWIALKETKKNYFKPIEVIDAA